MLNDKSECNIVLIIKGLLQYFYTVLLFLISIGHFKLSVHIFGHFSIVLYLVWFFLEKNLKSRNILLIRGLFLFENICTQNVNTYARKILVSCLKSYSKNGEKKSIFLINFTKNVIKLTFLKLNLHRICRKSTAILSSVWRFRSATVIDTVTATSPFLT